jgi:quinoprotein glucose dehydrogenase
MMSRRSTLVPLFTALLGISVGMSGQERAGATRQAAPANGDWPHYTADLRGTRYSPLDQINASNFNQLEVAWRFKTDNLGPRPEFKLEGTPVAVNGILYTTGGTRRSVIALDGKTGEQIWAHSLREGRRAGISPRQLSGRGVSYWTDGRGDERILYVTTGYRLVALNARNGAMISGFGSGGVVDLKQGAVFGNRQPIDLESGEIGLHATPTVVRDVAIVGSSFREGATVSTHNNTKGLVRAFDVRTGKTLWTFRTIPAPGEFGNETWENDSWAVNGNAGVWSQITVDEELGLVYLPVETPTSDFYGGHRPGNNLFAETLVCVDLKTGQRKWHFQLVHHPLWNYDMSSAPILADITVSGRAIKAVAVPGKQGALYVFDRVTGQPVWPIEERAVPRSDVPGEKSSPTQPFPTRPPAYARNTIKVPDDLIDFTPELRAQAVTQIARYRVAPWMYNPPVLGSVGGILGAINMGNAVGGTNWPGVAYDPETHNVIAQANNAGLTAGSLVPPPPGFSDIRYVSGLAGRPFQEVLGRRAGANAGGSTAGEPGRGRRRGHRPDRRGTAAGEAAVRHADRGESRSRRDRLAGPARRHAGQRSQSSGAQGAHHSQDRPGPDRRRRLGGHQDTGGDGRSADHRAAGPAARRDAARLRQGHRQGSGRGVDGGAGKRLADDLSRQRQAVHRRRRQRRQLLGRVRGVCAAGPVVAAWCYQPTASPSLR